MGIGTEIPNFNNFYEMLRENLESPTESRKMAKSFAGGGGRGGGRGRLITARNEVGAM